MTKLCRFNQDKPHFSALRALSSPVTLKSAGLLAMCAKFHAEICTYAVLLKYQHKSRGGGVTFYTHPVYRSDNILTVI